MKEMNIFEKLMRLIEEMILALDEQSRTISDFQIGVRLRLRVQIFRTEHAQWVRRLELSQVRALKTKNS